MLNYHVKVGLVPIRRDVTPRPGIFNWEKAEERCAAAVAYIEEHFTSENVSFVDLKGINAVDVFSTATRTWTPLSSAFRRRRWTRYS